MASIGWMQLSDLHQRADPEGLPRAGFTSDVRTDLERMYPRSGPWNLVLFAGDLAASGEDEEYLRVDEVYAKLCEIPEVTRSAPVLLAVPGNHDIHRASVATGKARAAALALTESWHRDESVRERFWRDPDAPGRRAVARAFAPFKKWWERAVRTQPGVDLRVGALPGDFSVTIEREGLRLGVVGLNTAFLNLAPENAWGRLAIDPRQLEAACGDVEAWVARHDVALLLTHHAPAWLHPAAKEVYAREINPRGRFALHLAGHMHDRSALNADDASEARVLCSLPLKGMWPFTTSRTPGPGGYGLGRVDLVGARGALRVWSRVTVVDDPPFFHLVANPTIEVGADEAFAFPVESRAATAPRALSAPGGALESFSVESASAPAESGDAGAFIGRESEMTAAVEALSRPGRPLLVWGPEGFGKTALLTHLTVALEPKLRVVRVDLSHFDPDAWESASAFLRELGAGIVRATEGSPEWIETLRRQRRSSLDALTTLLERFVVPAVRGQLAVAIDDAHLLLRHELASEVLEGMPEGLDYRNSLGLTGFHVVLSSAQPPDTFVREVRAKLSPMPKLELGGLSSDAITALARAMGLSASRDDLSSLAALVGGSPRLTVLALRRAARDRRPLGAVLAEARSDVAGGVFSDHLDRLRWWLRRDHGLLLALREVAAEAATPREPELYARLYELGLVALDPSGQIRLRAALYERLLR